MYTGDVFKFIETPESIEKDNPNAARFSWLRHGPVHNKLYWPKDFLNNIELMFISHTHYKNYDENNSIDKVGCFIIVNTIKAGNHSTNPFVYKRGDKFSLHFNKVKSLLEYKYTLYDISKWPDNIELSEKENSILPNTYINLQNFEFDPKVSYTKKEIINSIHRNSRRLNPDLKTKHSAILSDVSEHVCDDCGTPLWNINNKISSVTKAGKSFVCKLLYSYNQPTFSKDVCNTFIENHTNILIKCSHCSQTYLLLNPITGTEFTNPELYSTKSGCFLVGIGYTSAKKI